MDQKLSSYSAWSMTVVAALDMIALILMAAANPKFGLLVILAGCELMFILMAVHHWKKYFEALIEGKRKALDS